jgi:uncharacterized protein YoxC
MGQTWKEFCSSLNKVANKAAVKIEELSDSAQLHIKAKSIDVKLCEAFEKLGKLYYGQLDGEVGKADDIDACVKEIDRLKRELADVNAQIEQNKKKGDEEAQEPTEEPTADDQAQV